MKDFDEQFAALQKNLEPVQEMNSAAVQAFERIARKNYELMGDLVDFAVAQLQIPQGEATAQEVYEHQSAEAKAFAEKVNTRATEYMELAGELGGMVSSPTEAGAASSTKPAANKSAATKKTATAEAVTATKPKPAAKKPAAKKPAAKKAVAKKPTAKKAVAKKAVAKKPAAKKAVAKKAATAKKKAKKVTAKKRAS